MQTVYLYTIRQQYEEQTEYLLALQEASKTNLYFAMPEFTFTKFTGFLNDF
jgi:hypothetical protein